MTHSKFLKIGAAALAFAALATSVSLHHSEANTQAINQVVASAQVDNQQSSVDHHFTNVTMESKFASPSNPAGNVKEVVYQGKVVGEIKQFENHRQISSNLTPEETVKIFKELKQEGKADNIALNEIQNGLPDYKNIVQHLDGVQKSYVSPLETVLLSTSMAYRGDGVAASPSKSDVMNNIKKVRNKYVEDNSSYSHKLPKGLNG